MTEEMTNEQAESMLREYMDGKQNKHTFLRDIVMSDDTTKTGNLDSEELGLPNLELRGMKDLVIFSREVADDESWASYFEKQSEMLTATSLSKDGMLVKLGGTDKKEMADMTPTTKKENKGWFKKKS